MTENLLIRLQHLTGGVLIVNIARRQPNQLLFAFSGQQLHSAVTAGKLLVDVAVEHQIGGGVEERAQKRRLLFQLDLRLFAAGHLFAQLIHHLLARLLCFNTIVNFLVELRDGLFHLLVQL